MKALAFTPTRNFIPVAHPETDPLTIRATHFKDLLFHFILSLMSGIQIKEAAIEEEGHYFLSSISQFNLFKKEF